LVSGGVGFVGSNLLRRPLEDTPRRLAIVDNLLSADTSNIPEAPEIDFRLVRSLTTRS
jgi:nucleoside-diphosphate-sugar epimerase